MRLKFPILKGKNIVEITLRSDMEPKNEYLPNC